MSPPSRATTLAALALAGLVALTAGCSADWRTDMYYQPSHRAEDSPRPEPAYAVPLGAGVHVEDRDDAETLKNPVAADAASLAHGRALFAQRCSFCHGAAGHGGGPVSKFFPPAPDLAYPQIKGRTDGYVFGTITFGGRAMPAQAEGLLICDRWDLVNHVRAIQREAPAVAP